MPTDFLALFKTEIPARDKFLSRLFGIFNEEIVRCWARDPRAPYEDLGRPTLKAPGDARGYTLDFTLRRRTDGATFVAEMKCKLEYERYRYLTLTSPDQLAHHRKPAFTAFLKAARQPDRYAVRIGGKPITVHGAILIWGRVTDAGRRAVIDRHGFADVLSLESIITDLQTTENAEYRALLRRLAAWAAELFAGLTGPRALP